MPKQGPAEAAAARKFESEVRALRPGASIVYHTGYLGRDRLLDFTAHVVGDRAMRLCSQGLVHLTQRRVGHKDAGVCEYLATRSRRTAWTLS